MQPTWKPTINFKKGVTMMVKDINDWQDAPLWNKDSIYIATKDWFKYMNNK